MSDLQSNVSNPSSPLGTQIDAGVDEDEVTSSSSNIPRQTRRQWREAILKKLGCLAPERPKLNISETRRYGYISRQRREEICERLGISPPSSPTRVPDVEVAGEVVKPANWWEIEKERLENSMDEIMKK